MDINLFPTKGNLINAENTLKLCRQGYVLLDKKRNVLIKEMMDLIDSARTIQKEIDKSFAKAYKALQSANISVGIDSVQEISRSIPVDDSYEVRLRSVMGAELPVVSIGKNAAENEFGIYKTSSSLDIAYLEFKKVKELTAKLSETENSVYRLATGIKKTQKRANALKNIMIPRYEEITANIRNVLEEKEREDFSHMKVIKQQKEAKKSPRKGIVKNENGENKEQ